MFYISLNFEEQINAFQHCKPQHLTDCQVDVGLYKNGLIGTIWTAEQMVIYDIVIFIGLVKQYTGRDQGGQACWCDWEPCTVRKNSMLPAQFCASDQA